MKKSKSQFFKNKTVTLPFILLIGILLILIVPQIRNQIRNYKLLYTVYLFQLSFLISFLLIPLAMNIGNHFRFLDVPDKNRKLHKDTTPLTGGIAIFVAFNFTILFNFNFSIEMKAILVASTIIFISGLIDDRFGLTARLRLLIQVLCSLIVIIYGVRVTFIPVWWHFGYFIELIISLIWIIGITNSMNFIDGMDGIASGSCMIYAIFFAIIAFITKQSYLMYLSLAIGGSCLGFFLFNFRYKKSALIFLGDNGSTFLGFLVACLALLGKWGISIVDIVVPILILSVLIFDMALSTFLRIYRKEVRTFKEWIEYTGRDHFHYQLNSIGLSKRLSVIIYLCVSICFGLAAIAILFSDVIISLVVLLHSIFAFIIIGTILVFGNKELKNNNPIKIKKLINQPVLSEIENGKQF